MLSEEAIEAYIKSGKIAREIKKKVKNLVKPGTSYKWLAEKIENEIRAMGGEPAFPCNLSMASEAAHYTPLIDDEKVMESIGILKVDFGVHVNGYISDTSVSIDLSGEHEDLVKATEEALEKALGIVRPGVKIRDIAETISKTISYYNARPIRNLTGHSLERYNLHSGVSIPNSPSIGVRGTLKAGMAVAIEPFATHGIGYVVDSPTITIYALRGAPIKRKHLKGSLGRLFDIIYRDRRGLPFTERWYSTFMDKERLRETINEMLKKRLLHAYPVLVEASGSQVAQSEDSVLILEKETIAYTRL